MELSRDKLFDKKEGNKKEGKWQISWFLCQGISNSSDITTNIDNLNTICNIQEYLAIVYKQNKPVCRSYACVHVTCNTSNEVAILISTQPYLSNTYCTHVFDI